jgi:predicted Na+-dependent transporter
MNEPRLRPKVIVWWGIAVAVGGALLVVLVPWVLNMLIGNSQGQQDFQVIVQTVLQVAASVLPPLGAALIAAGIVMTYVERLFSARMSPTSSEPEDLLR